jgi:hypothetical protein
MPSSEKWHRLNDVNFDSLKLLKQATNAVAFPKVIVRPERVKHIHAHEVVAFEVMLMI